MATINGSINTSNTVDFLLLVIVQFFFSRIVYRNGRDSLTYNNVNKI